MKCRSVSLGQSADVDCVFHYRISSGLNRIDSGVNSGMNSGRASGFASPQMQFPSTPVTHNNPHPVSQQASSLFTGMQTAEERQVRVLIEF